MAVTSVAYNGDGVTVDFDITFDYTSIAFVKAYVNGVLTTGWSFLDEDTARFTVAPPVGVANVELRRETSTVPLVDFVASATITDTSLDLAILQQLHILEEIENNSLVGMQQSGGNWDATSDRIVNLSTPLAATDAANKDYVDDVIGSVADAEAAEAGAEAAEAGALAQAAAAAASAAASAASAVAAANSAAAADASADSISTVIPISGLTTNQIPIVSGAAVYTNEYVRLFRRISQPSGSAVAQVDIPLTGSYAEYLLELFDFLPANDNTDLHLRFSNDGGGTYLSGGTDYNYVTDQRVNGSNFGTDSNSDSKIIVANRLSNARVSRAFSIRIFMGNGAGVNNGIHAQGFCQVNAQESCVLIGAGEMTVAATRATHLRLFMSAGNITTLSGNLYGVTR